MSKACIVCGSKYKKDTILSFHRFPKGPEIRKKWLDAIGIEDINVGPTTFVCSKHFRIVDFADNMYHWPKKMLLPHAFPQPSACYKIQKKNLGSLEKSESIEDTFKQSSGSDVESYESPSSTSTDPLVKEEYDLTIEEPTISEDIMPTVITICTEPCTSNGTYTNSFMQRDYTNFPLTPKYIGNLRVEHFSTPEQTKRSIEFIKDAFNNKTKKIRLLRVQKDRLEKRIGTIKVLFQDMIKMNLVPQEAYKELMKL